MYIGVSVFLCVCNSVCQVFGQTLLFSLSFHSFSNEGLLMNCGLSIERSLFILHRYYSRRLCVCV